MRGRCRYTAHGPSSPTCSARRLPTHRSRAVSLSPRACSASSTVPSSPRILLDRRRELRMIFASRACRVMRLSGTPAAWSKRVRWLGEKRCTPSLHSAISPTFVVHVNSGASARPMGGPPVVAMALPPTPTPNSWTVIVDHVTLLVDGADVVHRAALERSLESVCRPSESLRARSAVASVAASTDVRGTSSWGSADEALQSVRVEATGQWL